jgi:hypothetical protein
MMLFDRAEFIALVISIGLESLFVICWGGFYRRDWKLLTIAATIGTLITHPILWQLFIRLSPYLSFNIRSIFLELLVALFEGIIYRMVTGYNWKTCLALSLSANLCSYSVGLAIARL